MRINKKSIVAALLVTGATMSFTSCGERATAKATVKDFLETNLQGKDLSILDCGELDSTQRVTTQTLQHMRQANFPKASYEAMPKSGKLRYMSVKYVVNEKDTTQQTFYMDEKLSGIVAVKQEWK